MDGEDSGDEQGSERGEESAEVTRCAEHPSAASLATCVRCGSFVCEECLLPNARGQPDVRAPCKRCVLVSSSGKPWSPTHLAAAAFFFGFAAPIFLHALNYPRLGLPPRRPIWYVALAGGTVGYFAFAFFAPEELARTVAMSGSVGAALLIWSSQKPAFDRYLKAGGEVRSGWPAAGISLATTLAVLAIMFGVGYVTAVDAFAEASAALESGDHDRARELFDEQCEEGEPAACTNIGYMDANGFGGPRDLRSAREYYGRGCDGGDPTGCQNLGSLLSGEAPDRALELFERACAGGLRESCAALGR